MGRFVIKYRCTGCGAVKTAQQLKDETDKEFLLRLPYTETCNLNGCGEIANAELYNKPNPYGARIL